MTDSQVESSSPSAASMSPGPSAYVFRTQPIPKIPTLIRDPSDFKLRIAVLQLFVND